MRIHILGNEYAGSGNAGRIMEEIRLLLNNHEVTSSYTEKNPGNFLQAMFSTNLFSPIWLSKEFMNISQKGVIINMVSLAGISPFPGLSLYGMTKAALISLTKSLSLELAPYNIRVNGVAPGVVKTRMGDSLLKIMDLNEQDFAKKFTLTGKLIDPDEVADTVLYLIRNESMTGQVITIDSGGEQMATDYFR